LTVAVFQSGPDALVYDVVILLLIIVIPCGEAVNTQRRGEVYRGQVSRGRALVDSPGRSISYSKRGKAGSSRSSFGAQVADF
jgi:hypothetical protein